MEYSKNSHTLILKVDDWEEVLLLKKHLDRWLFRGQKRADWVLKTTLERAFEFRDIDKRLIPQFELISLNDFRKIAHNFSSKLPDYDDRFAWFALMQHYGSPTRLLDFTESFYIAAYFALLDAKDSCAIWAINRTEIIKTIKERINYVLTSLGYMSPGEATPDNFINLIMQHAIAGDIQEKFIFTASPSRLNERQYIQQGLSVIPSNLSNGFMDTLLKSFDEKCKMSDEQNFNLVDLKDTASILDNTKVLKLILTKDCFLDARTDLNKMSVNSLTLFRGLDGLGKHQYDILNSFENYERKKQR